MPPFALLMPLSAVVALRLSYAALGLICLVTFAHIPGKQTWRR
jgi:hypothetical protein